MTYTLGGEFTFNKLTSADKVATLNTKHALTGFRAFARVEKTGKYREIFGISQEDEGTWVQGVNEGFWFHHTHEDKATASKLAWKAYRWLNK
jgi:hypothetical protein